ncbi:MAG: DUF169 domain-containing protein [Thermoplasmata archaeon]|nr:DUF169 domain-containing protein [Thermoplasmata archaeon]MCI4337706.1 DUF169 domain-containing protein [Thermoplasmata archaeon]MCI4341612.1 DUF169 domain-containing protein [Thermoplasmata archaeon]
MPSHWEHLAEELVRELELDLPPVQISYLEAPPAGVAEHPGGSPSVCTFFAEGKTHAFYAGKKAHEECEVGAFVMGIPPEGELGQRLMSTIGMMQKEAYLEPGEEAKVPHNAKAPSYVAYGPLGKMSVPPTNVLLFARPKSAMFALEAAHFAAPLNGRPMCAIVPILNAGAPVAISTGCIGSRIYTEMGDDRMVVGIRGDHVEKFLAELRRIRQANAAVATEDSRRKKSASHPYGK